MRHLEIIARHPKKDLGATPLLFVHGAWHGAWCWEHFQSYFAEQGYSSYALSLRGHGASDGRDRLRWVRAAEYVEDLAQAAGQLRRAPVLVGHSAGGYLIQKYLESHSAAAAVLLASLPVNGALQVMNRFAARHPWQTVKMHLTREPFFLIETPELVREAFFSKDIPPEQLARYVTLLQTESYRLGWDASFFNRPRPNRVRKLPLLVLGGENDAVISKDDVERTASAYNARAEFLPDTAHDMMLEKTWIKAAGRIRDWLRERDL